MNTKTKQVEGTRRVEKGGKAEPTTKLWRIRFCLKVSPEEIVRYTSISCSFYRQVERGRSRPSQATAEQILLGLNSLLSEEKRKVLRQHGFLSDQQQGFQLADLEFMLPHRKGGDLDCFQKHM